MLRHIFVSTSAMLLLFAATASARSGGAPTQTSGAPGDGVCTRCHTGTVNSGPGSVKLSFAGGTMYNLNETKRVTVTIDSPNGRRWGFEVSPRVATDAENRGAGLMAIVNDMTQTQPPDSNGKQWITHTSAGTRQGTTGPVTFEFDWTAPASNVGNVTFYVAANAANGNGNNQGDEIYTATATLTPPGASGSPAISQNGVVNAASFQPGISAGSWITIAGTNLSSATRQWSGSEIVDGVLPTALDGISLTVNGKPAAIAFISPTQINALSPDDDNTGNVEVKVKTPAGESTAVTATVQRFAPALFQFNTKYAAAVHADGTSVGPPGFLGSGVTTRPVKAGDQILLFGTGFGPTNPATPANRVASAAAPLANNVQITVGGVPATVQFAGVAPPSPGLIQFNITIPAGVASGDQPVVATVGGAATPSGINLAVQ